MGWVYLSKDFVKSINLRARLIIFFSLGSATDQLCALDIFLTLLSLFFLICKWG